MQGIEENMLLEAAVQFFEQHDTQAMEVLDAEGHVVGVLTQSDLDAAICNGRLSQRVGDWMRYRVTGSLPQVDAADVSTHGFNREPLRSVLDALHDGVYITDAKGITVAVNSAYERITGIGRNDVIGFHMADLVRAGYISKSVSLEVLRERRSITLVQTIRDDRKIVVSGSPMFGASGQLEWVVTNVRDVTELLHAKHAEDQLAQLQRMRTAYGADEYAAENEAGVIISETTRECYDLAKRVSATQVKVLIQGETGTGKTLLARYIHQHSQQAEGPFMELNCAALPEGLLEAELFGYTPGAFTGASARGKQGLLEVASGGTLFLDEIGDLPLSLQAKLLKVIEEQRFLPLGGTEFRHTNLRLITATHRDLHQGIKDGHFREDLYYRISVVPLMLPPLRQRRDEIIPLLEHYLKIFNQRHGIVRHWHPEALELLAAAPWPGNIRELINLTERLVVTLTEEDISPGCLPSDSLPPAPASAPMQGSLREQVNALERHLIEAALASHGTTRSAAAALGIDQSTLVKKTRRWRQENPPSPLT